MKYEFKLEIDIGERNVTQEDLISSIDKVLSTISNDLQCFSNNISISLYENTEEKTDVMFEKWWELYDKKRGKKKSYARWCRMSMKDKVACLNAVKDYVKSTPDIKYRKDPLTYLNGECWNDEIILSQTLMSGINTGIIIHDTKNKDYEKGWK